MQMNFGKHKGKTLDWIVENDFGYAEWLYNWLLHKAPNLSDRKTSYEFYLTEMMQELRDSYKIGHPWKNPKYAELWAKY